MSDKKTPKPYDPASVVANAEKYIGSNNYDHYCEKFAENAYNTGGAFPSAKAAYNYALSTKTLQNTPNAPAGALVFFKGNKQYGHVAISDGKGNVISSGIDGKVQRISLGGLQKKWGDEGTHLGWTMPTQSFFKNGHSAKMEKLNTSSVPTSTGVKSNQNRSTLFSISSIGASLGRSLGLSPQSNTSSVGSTPKTTDPNLISGTNRLISR